MHVPSRRAAAYRNAQGAVALNDSALFASLHPQLPVLTCTAKRALDLGCGDHPIFHDAHVADECFGADPQVVRAGFPIVVCEAETLPFADASFDLIVSRVAIPYMNIPKALREMHRILTPGGRLWATLHLPTMALRRIGNCLRKLDVLDATYQLYAMANCCLLPISSFQIPWIDGRFESVQTPRSMSVALNRAGFSTVQTEICRDEEGRRHFAVQAQKTVNKRIEASGA
jgi:SAM-dependent methyltransferase